MDRRADHVVVNRPQGVERFMDINALAAGAYRALEQAYEAHYIDPPHFVRAITVCEDRIVRIGKAARAGAGELETAPAIDPNQLEVWTRPDEAVVMASGTAA